MISYEPLYRQLESKRMTMQSLSNLVGYEYNNLSMLLRKKNVHITTLVKICQALGCSIGDVICYKPIQKEDYKRKHIRKPVEVIGVRPDWNKITNLCGPLSLVSVEIGHASNFLTQKKIRNSVLSEDVVNAICDKYSLSKEDFCD